MSATSLPLLGAAPRPAAPRLTLVLLSLGVGQLLVWLGTALHNFYAGQRLLVLPVQAWLRFGAHYPHRSVMLPTAAGAFSTGTQGELLFRPTALSDYFLFYHLGSFTGLDALFLAGASVYLWWALGRRPATAPAAGRALAIVGAASLLMYVLSLGVGVLAQQVFQAKTQQLFSLGGQPGANLLYVLLGLVLSLSSQFLGAGQPRQPAPAPAI